MVVASGALCRGFAGATASPTVKFPTDTRERIAIASYPFRDFIVGGEKKPVSPAIHLKDFAAHVNEKFGVRKIEPWTGHFGSTDSKYLEQFREALEKSKGFVANMYEEWGGAPGAGVVTGLARIHTRLVMIIANDATVKAGAFFPMTSKKVIRAQNIAIENRIPTIYLVDSAGVFLPLQEDVFPDTDDFGRVFRNNAVMSAMGIPQIAAIMKAFRTAAGKQ